MLRVNPALRAVAQGWLHRCHRGARAGGGEPWRAPDRGGALAILRLGAQEPRRPPPIRPPQPEILYGVVTEPPPHGGADRNACPAPRAPFRGARPPPREWPTADHREARHRERRPGRRRGYRGGRQ